MSTAGNAREAARWLLLIHQIPPKPDYLRVKIGRRLQRIGAVAVKNSVYVLPDTPTSLEDFQWIRAEIIEGAGDASICRASFLDGLTDPQIEHLFREARDADYAEIACAAVELTGTTRRHRGDASHPRSPRAEEDLARLRKRFAAVLAIDHFTAEGRALAEEGLRNAAAALAPPGAASDARVGSNPRLAAYRGRTWVTRAGIFVDRIASAWLIRRFIDPDARFRFAAAVERGEGELRFDTFEGEFTHEGDRCTFEVLLARFGLDDPALQAIAEIVHDIDLKDGKFGRDDTPGIERVVSAIAAAHVDDAARMDRGSRLFDDLFVLFSGSADASATERPR